MRLTLSLVLLLTFHLSASVYSQQTKLSLNLTNVTIREVLNQIEEQSDFNFLIQDERLDLDRKISFNFEQLGIKEILDHVFSGQDVRYVITGKNLIIITPGNGENHNRGEAVQPRKVSGKVVDANGQPLPGVTVVIKGTNAGTVTDTAGQFSLSDIPSNATFQFSFIGMKTQEVSVGNQSTINLVMEEDAVGIEEVVAIGYGKQSKRNVTGSISKVGMEKNDVLPNTNVLQSLRGTVAGVVFTDTGRPGQGGSLLIRGNRSISAGNSPLYILDGVFFNGDISDLNPNDIESMEILKDPSSCAIYGSKAANGVVLITSKMGKNEKPTFNLNTYYGIQDYSYKPNLLSPDRWIQKILDYRTESGLESNPANIESYLSPDEVENYRARKTIDPWEVVKQFAPISSADISVSAKTAKTSYYLSSSFSSEKGIIYGDKADKLSFRANFDNQITSWLSIGFNSMFAIRDLTGVTAETGFTWRLSPYGKMYVDEAETKPRRFPQTDGLVINPMWNPLYDTDDEKQQNLFANFYAEVDFPFLKGLKYRMNYSPNYRWGHLFYFSPAFDEQGVKQSGYAKKDQNETVEWVQENILSYLGSIGKDHEFDITLMYGLNHSNSQKTLASAQSFFSNSVLWNSLQLGGIPSVSSGESTVDGISSMARLNYRLKSRYLLTLTMRRDGYSGFGENNKFGNFPSVALAWIATEEGFLKNQNLINFLKVRASYGKTGNQAISPYQSLSSLSTTPYVYGDGAATTVGIYPSNMANNSLSWETTTGTNLAVDFEMIKSRISGTIEYYNLDTDDLLLKRALPSMNGFESVFANIGATKNTGVEITLNSVNIRKNKFEWSSGFNFSLNNNKIVHLYQTDTDNNGKEDNDIGNSWFIGEPIGVYYDYVFDGIYQEGDDMPEGYKAGYVRLKNLDDDEKITDKDRQIIGNKDAKYRWSLNNNFSYNRFSFSFLINSLSGWITPFNEIYPKNLAYATNFIDEGDGWWTPTNKSNTKPSLKYPNPYNHAFYKSRDFIRIQEVSVSYDVPAKLLKSLNVNKVKLYVSGKNLYTFTKYPGFDPENGSSVSFPMPRSIVTGININF